jgi:ubiquinone/menaquinone biosynthesis C-methylase UbiE
MKESAEQFNPIAQNYAESPVHREGPSLGVLLRLAEPRDTDVVLDIATGTGHTAMALAPSVNSVVGIDLAERMLAEANRLSRERTLANVFFQRASAENLPFPDKEFTLVTSRLAPHHFRQLKDFLSESHRVLQPGGRLVVADQISPTRETKDWINRWETIRDPSHYDQRTPEEWRKLAERAGFAWATAETVFYRLEFEWWVKQANCSAECVEKLREHARQATPAVRSALRLAFNETGQVLEHHLPVMVVRLEKRS